MGIRCRCRSDDDFGLASPVAALLVAALLVAALLVTALLVPVGLP